MGMKLRFGASAPDVRVKAYVVMFSATRMGRFFAVTDHVTGCMNEMEGYHYEDNG
jgi:hypothetical protein